jgi:antitoxin YefM
MKSMENDLGKESELSEMDLGKNNEEDDFVLISKETQHLLSSKKNREKLAESIKQMKNSNLLSYNFNNI